MPTARRFTDFFDDLRQLERAPHGEAILDVFTRHTAFSGGAVYLRDAREGPLRLAARVGQCVALEILDGDPPADLVTVGDRVLVPLRTHREQLGLIELTNADGQSDDDLDLLRAGGTFLS